MTSCVMVPTLAAQRDGSGRGSSAIVTAHQPADSAYRGQELAGWCKVQGYSELEVVERPPRRPWSHACFPKDGSWNGPICWLSRNRRMSKDDERKVQTSETLIEVAMIRLLVTRRGRCSSAQDCCSPGQG